MLRGIGREMAAEFLGTFMLIVFGVGVVAQVTFSAGGTARAWRSTSRWGLAVMFGVYVAVGVSGAHLNPAVTLAVAVRRGFPWSKVAPYMAAQFAGAFVASVVVYVHLLRGAEPFRRRRAPGIGRARHGRHLGDVPQAVRVDVPRWLHRPSRRHGPPHGRDRRDYGFAERRAPAGLAPVLVGLLVVLIGATFGYNTGYAINPGA